MALQPGDALFNGHYRIIRQLGRGGFGFVYLAQDTLLAEEVAIKELIPALVGDDTSLKRFLAEAKATMRLTHRRIVRTHNVFSEGGNYYIVMEYMPGGSLEDRLGRQAPLPVVEAVRIAAEVCDGLACAHEAGVVHCDLKPHNILFDSGNSAKVADFGIAHVSGETLTRSWMTPAGFVAGTLPYMSPEQADGVRDDPRIDIYAAGAMLYRMLTGRTYLEFDSRETPGATADNVNRIRNQAAKAPSTGNRSVPAWLDAVVLKALAKRPVDRYPSAEAMHDALAGRRAPVAVPAVRHGADRRGRARFPTWAWVLLSLAAVILILLGLIAAGVLDSSVEQQGGVATSTPRFVAVTATEPEAKSVPAASAPDPTTTATASPTALATLTPAPSPSTFPTMSLPPAPTPTSAPPTATATGLPPTLTPAPKPILTPAPPTRTPLRGKIAYRMVPEWGRYEERGIYLLDLASGETTRLGYGQDPSLSPDGSVLLYGGETGATLPGIWRLDFATGQHEQLTSTHHDRRPAMSWDGSRIAYESGGPLYVWQNGNVTKLGDGDWASWSPDGNWIALSNWGIFKIPASGGQPVKLADANLRCGDYATGRPAWSVTGQIAYMTDCDIWTMNPDGSRQTRLTDHPAADYAPAWSPDGNQIVFVSERDGQAELYVMNANGSGLVRLTDTTEGESVPSWSR